MFTEIEDVKDGVILFIDGSAAMIVSVSAVNFGLLSEREQDAIIYAYAGFLNSLSFPIQILVRTQQKDVTAYLRSLEEQQERQKNPKLVGSIKAYRAFIATTVKEKDVLDKKFYIVIPFSNLELGAAPSLLFGTTKKRGLPYPKPYIWEKAKTALSPKRDHVIRILARVGLRSTAMTDELIVRLFFGIYNPGSPAPVLPLDTIQPHKLVSGAPTMLP